MMASEFIKKLQEMVEEHGDHPIISRGEDGGTAYVCADVRDVRTILKMYRRGQRRG